MSLLAFHDFEAVEDLAVRRTFPDSEDHGLAEPTFDWEFRYDAEGAVNFHGPLGGLRGEFGRPVFRQMRHQTEEMVAVRIGRALLADFVEEGCSFPGESKRLAKTAEAVFELAAQERLVEDGVAAGPAAVGKRKRFGQGALRDRRACERRCDAGDVEELECGGDAG